MSRRIITTDVTEEDKKIETSLRPQLLGEYIGQERIKGTLKIFIDAAKSRNEPLDHVLFTGRRDWERRRSAALLPMRWASI